jgi:hypothetical protein
MSFAAVEMVTLYNIPIVNAVCVPVIVSFVLFHFQVHVPGSGTIENALCDADIFIFSLNFTIIGALVITFVAVFAGFTETINGGDESIVKLDVHVSELVPPDESQTSIYTLQLFELTTGRVQVAFPVPDPLCVLPWMVGI